MNRIVTFLSFCCLLASTAPAQASELQRSLIRFCNSIQEINRNGFSAAPGTPAARLIVSRTNYGHDSYRTVWAFAQGSGAVQCRGIW